MCLYKVNLYLITSLLVNPLPSPPPPPPPLHPPPPTPTPWALHHHHLRFHPLIVASRCIRLELLPVVALCPLHCRSIIIIIPMNAEPAGPYIDRLNSHWQTESIKYMPPPPPPCKKKSKEKRTTAYWHGKQTNKKTTNKQTNKTSKKHEWNVHEIVRLRKPKVGAAENRLPEVTCRMV